MFIGCYSADVYCDFCDKDERGVNAPLVHPAGFHAQNHAACVRQMKRAGWTFQQVNCVRLDRCPACTKENRRTVSPNHM